MRQEPREAYVQLLELIEDAGYKVHDEEFYYGSMDPEFDVELTLTPPLEKE